MRVQAVTEDVQITARIASFYPLNDEARQDVISAVAEVLKSIGKKHDFLVWRVSMQTESVK